MDFGFVMPGDLDGGVEEEGPEEVERPFEAFDECHPGEDEDGAQDQRAEDAPEQHPEAVGLGDLEEGEDDGPDEDVVDGQGLLDEVAGEVLAGGASAVSTPHDEREGEAEADPDGALDRRRPY